MLEPQPKDWGPPRGLPGAPATWSCPLSCLDTRRQLSLSAPLGLGLPAACLLAPRPGEYALGPPWLPTSQLLHRPGLAVGCVPSPSSAPGERPGPQSQQRHQLILGNAYGMTEWPADVEIWGCLFSLQLLRAFHVSGTGLVL